MAITKEKYAALPDGRDVYQYKLENGAGLAAYILDYGGIITRLLAPDRQGNRVDVVLGWDSLEDYIRHSGTYFGAAVGPNANRIAGARFSLHGTEYTLEQNDHGNNLHSAGAGLSSRVWDAETDGDRLVLRITSPDGDGGFPGNKQITVTYALTPENGLLIRYTAQTDKDTLLNMTNHSYFNLAGHNSGDAGGLVLQMNSAYYTPNTDGCYPDGEVLSVTGTPFDFRAPKPIGQDWNADFEQIQKFGGYDHNFVIDGRGFRRAAVLFCPGNGITMDVWTDTPGIQVYTGNMYEEEGLGKDGAQYGPHQSVCLETQYFPNAVHYTQFPVPIVRAGGQYDSKTEFRFSVN